MAGCVPCFVVPLLLFIFHRYIQPLLLKIWNPWEKLPQSDTKMPSLSECPCNKAKSDDVSCSLTKKNKEAALEKNEDSSCQLIGKEKSA